MPKSVMKGMRSSHDLKRRINSVRRELWKASLSWKAITTLRIGSDFRWFCRSWRS